jgi:threonine/homoserine/homoserine lactone efflux protein
MIHLFWLGFALAASPGPDFFLILRHTLSFGRIIGYATLLGNRLSLCVHISLAILGLSIVLQQSLTVFLFVRFLGAAYLVYLGSRYLLVRARPSDTQAASPEAIKFATAFGRGFLNNLLNPKVSLFFLSFFPQFATREMLGESPWLVALSFFAGNTSWWVPLILVVGISTFRAGLYRLQRILDTLFGIVFIIFGLRIVVDEFVRHFT